MLATQFQAILRQFPRVAIAGGPRMGKSTLSRLAKDRPVIGTDAYKGDMPWSEIPAAMIRDTAGLDRYIIEGVQVARALRGPMGPDGKRGPGIAVDAVVYLQAPKVADRLPGQVSMAKAVRTVFDQWHALNRSVPVFFESVPAVLDPQVTQTGQLGHE